MDLLFTKKTWFSRRSVLNQHLNVLSWHLIIQYLWSSVLNESTYMNRLILLVLYWRYRSSHSYLKHFPILKIYKRIKTVVLSNLMVFLPLYFIIISIQFPTLFLLLFESTYLKFEKNIIVPLNIVNRTKLNKQNKII